MSGCVGCQSSGSVIYIGKDGIVDREKTKVERWRTILELFVVDTFGKFGGGVLGGVEE